MKKRIVSLLLAVCMTASLLAVSASGAQSVTFADVGDRSTAMAVESLRLMGVLDGYRDGTFRPNASLTRAQFCKMVVYAMNASEELGRYSMVTVFPDVKPSYWAASYINMAAKGKKVIAGFADGRFHPDNTVTVGQAVTILVRLLGYTDEDVGGIWPQGHMATAATIGLTEGVSSNAYAKLTRGQAARLFLNLLRMEKKEGGDYISDLGTTVEGQVLVSCSAAAPDGSKTGLQTAEGTVYQLSNNKISNGVLNGQKGTLVLDKKGGKVLTFVPDSVGSSKSGTVSEAKANLLTLTDGSKYAMSSSTELYLDNKQSTWGESFAMLTSGSSVTLYLSAAGTVEYVFAGGGAAADKAVIIYENQSAAGLDALTGGVTGYQIYKDGVLAGAGDLRKYDVATYSSVSNSIRVCDNRISGYYEDCSPNPQTPTTVTVLGHVFNVLPSAVESLSQFKPGQQVTFLLTEDNQIAGAIEAKGGISGNVLGIVKSVSADSAKVELLCGVTVEGKASLSASSVEQLEGQLVRVSSTRNGLSLTKATSSISGDLNVSARTVGTKTLAENVRILQRTAEGLKTIGLSQITTATVPKSDISYVGQDWAGRVNVLVIGGANNSVVLYGRTVVREETTGSGEDADTIRTIAVEYGVDQTFGPITTNYEIPNGAFVKATLNAAGTRYTGLRELTGLKKVPASAWIGTTAVTFGARTYTVAEDVACYNQATGTWTTLAAARAYSDTLNLYVENGAVRVVEIPK